MPFRLGYKVYSKILKSVYNDIKKIRWCYIRSIIIKCYQILSSDIMLKKFTQSKKKIIKDYDFLTLYLNCFNY
jgi:hypothetical protein